MWLLSIANRESYMGFRLDVTLNDLKGKFKEGVKGWVMFSKVVTYCCYQALCLGPWTSRFLLTILNFNV